MICRTVEEAATAAAAAAEAPTEAQQEPKPFKPIADQVVQPDLMKGVAQ